MEPENEKWINDILRSTEGMQRVEPSPFLFAKIRNRLQTERLSAHVSPRMVWLTVASFALLLLLNWRVIYQPPASPPAQAADLATVATEMHLFPASNQLY